MTAIGLSEEHTVMGGFEMTDMFTNLNPNDMPLWPALFITIACGAISGFHATQSPLMARCMENEKNGRFVFYGAMIGEGIIALIWCAIALSFFGTLEGLGEAVKNGGLVTWFTARPSVCWVCSVASSPSWAWLSCQSLPVTPRSAQAA